MATNWEALRAGLRRSTARRAAAFTAGGMPADVARAAAVACNVARFVVWLDQAPTDGMRDRAAVALVVARELVLETPDAAGILWREQSRAALSVLAANGPMHATGAALVFLAGVAGVASAVAVNTSAAAFAALFAAQRAVCADWAKHRDTLANIEARGTFAPSKVAA